MHSSGMTVFGCALLLASAQAAVPSFLNFGGSQVSSDPATPWFCHGLDCPTFELDKTYGDIELRNYGSGGAWASTKVSGTKYDKAVTKGFMRLFSYISGANVPNKKIEMTAPVRVKVTPGDGPFCESFFTISFFVPFDYQVDPPEPTNKDIFIEYDDEDTSFYVLSYGGWTSESKMLQRAEELVDALDKESAEYDFSYFYTAGYDPPFRLIGRHNEIWIPAKKSGPLVKAPEK